MKLFKLPKRLWLYPLAAIALTTVVAVWALRTVKAEVRRKLETELRTILSADITAMEVWMESRLRTASFLASQTAIRESVSKLADMAAQPGVSGAALRQSEAYKELIGALAGVEEGIGFRGFNVISREGVRLATRSGRGVGIPVRGSLLSNLSRVFETGEPQLVIPLQGIPVLGPGGGRGRRGGGLRRGRAGEPGARATNSAPRITRESAPGDNELQRELGVTLSAPVKNAHGEVAAVLGFEIRPEGEFTRVLTAARFGESGETYGFNSEGVMISQSRFVDELKAAGLLRNETNASTVLQLELRDPGGDLTRGFKSEKPRPECPLIRNVEGALADDETGIDVTGFRDYRGVEVVGAWRWLPKYEIGIATQVDYAEAYRPLLALQRIFLALISVLAASAGGLLFYSVMAVRLRHQVQEAELVARELGQYQLEAKIGEGGMGVVYRARHALLRRPTAIKLLLPGRADPQWVAQFEQEVQLTSRLTHPNTIQIYDYGRTEDGVFYYAMEYLDGINLRDLVNREGPTPPGRVIYILLQVCSSLSEAHQAGLVHRDIKPANVFLTNRGGQPDWVKVLDFGLVAQLDGPAGGDAPGLSRHVPVGTPNYMAPEAYRTPQSVDARVDIYGVGAVGYFLVTGANPFEEWSDERIRTHLLSLEDSARVTLEGLAEDGDLARVIRACLATDPANRPQDVFQLAAQLRACREAASWTPENSRQWWARFQPVSKEAHDTGTGRSVVVDIHRRQTQSPVQAAPLQIAEKTVVLDPTRRQDGGRSL